MALLLARSAINRCLCIKTYVVKPLQTPFYNSTSQRLNIIRNNTTNKYGLESQNRYLRVEKKWLDRDKIHPQYKMIYKSLTGFYFGLASFGSTGLMIVGIITSLFSTMTIEDLYVIPIENSDRVIVKDDKEFYMFCGMFLLMIFALRLVTRRFVLRIYQHKNSYIAVFQGPLPGLKTKHYFVAGDVVHTPSNSTVQWEESKYVMNGRTVYMLEDYFRTPRDLKRMLADFVPDEYEENHEDKFENK